MEKTGFEKVKDSGHIGRVYELVKKIWPLHYTPIIGRAQVDYMMATYQSKQNIEKEISAGAEYFLIIHGGMDSGYLAYEKRGDEMYLSKLYVPAEKRNRGIGRAGFDFVQNAARRDGLKKISLNVNKRNVNAIGAYKKFGFTVAREMVKDLGEGYVMDDYVMEKKL